MIRFYAVPYLILPFLYFYNKRTFSRRGLSFEWAFVDNFYLLGGRSFEGAFIQSTTVGFNVSWVQVDVCHLIKSTTFENIYGCSCIYSHFKLVSLYFQINIMNFFCRFSRVHRVKVLSMSLLSFF